MEKKWYLAEILEEFQSADSDTALLHINWILVNAADDDEAYAKALDFGVQKNTEYHNTDGVLVTVTFRGLRDLTEIYEEFADGSEIAFSRITDISNEEIERMASPKEELTIFRPRELDDF